MAIKTKTFLPIRNRTDLVEEIKTLGNNTKLYVATEDRVNTIDRNYLSLNLPNLMTIYHVDGIVIIILRLRNISSCLIGIH